jgi:Ca-activated chloride channel family protein
MRMRMRSLLIGVMVVAALAVTRGAPLSIRGKLVDSTGGPLPGATVVLSRDATQLATTVADSEGAFAFPDVPDGDYVITATLSGFRPVTHRIHVSAGKPPDALRLVMDLSGVTESLTVTAASPLVATQRSTIAGARRGGRSTPNVLLLQPPRPFSTATYDPIQDNGFKRVADAPLSTFSIDVDTASYTNVRRFLSAGSLPPADAVRVEELINYFHFDYAAPHEGQPVGVTTEVGPCPWNDRHRLALIGLHSTPIPIEALPPRNLVFLLDVSGSMQPANRLPLVQSAMLLLTDTLREQDRVAIVVYAGASGVALPATPGNRKRAIERAIQELQAGGSTNGAQGIELAYRIAADQFVPGGINRVILATDGDFNVGVTSPGDLVRLIERKREAGVFLSVLGVGDDNLKDATMEKLADAGNGNYSYLDSLAEAQRVLVAQGGATLSTVAKDVKIQVEFNPQRVEGYRLIGYEDRLLATEDFKDDRKDAGELGAGHTVTALYEIVPAGDTSSMPPPPDTLKYQAPRTVIAGHSAELMTVHVRYKAPDGQTSVPMAVTVGAEASTPSGNLGFAAAVAEFGMLLRDSPHKRHASWRQAASLAKANRGADPDGYRAEFIRLVDLAASLHRQRAEIGDRK